MLSWIAYILQDFIANPRTPPDTQDIDFIAYFMTFNTDSYIYIYTVEEQH